jgi:uncharacterized membrane protein YcjF (UPF0283 family)
VRPFILYSLARFGLFVAAFVLIWLLASRWVEWNTPSVLAIAVLAMIVSAIASLLLLGRLRDQFAATLAQRAAAMRSNVDRSRRKEDVD